MLPTLTVPPHSVTNAHGTPLIDDNVTDLCYYSMYNKCYNDSDPLIHGIITSICDIIRGGTLSVPYTLESSVTHTKMDGSDLLRPRIKKIKKTRYQRNVKIFIFTVVCLLIGLTE